jgi:hypothetical protein
MGINAEKRTAATSKIAKIFALGSVCSVDFRATFWLASQLAAGMNTLVANRDARTEINSF